MVRFLWHRLATRPEQLPAGDSLLDRPDLRIGNLLDDPRLRRAMGLDTPTVPAPQRRFDRRRLLDDAAA